MCQTILAGQPTADGYALLGMILQAHQVPDGAADAIRRALYLDPNHREALNLALGMALATGQTAVADGLRARLQKLPAEVRS